MSSYTHAYTYPPGEFDYTNEQLYDYDNVNSPSSFGDGSHAMAATNSSQSMSSTSSSWEWDAQQQCYVPNYTTMLSFPSPENQAYVQPGAYLQQQPQSPPGDPTSEYQLQYALQQQPPTQDLPRSQRSNGHGSSSPPRQFVCLKPGCGTLARFTRAADLARHMNTVHDVKHRYPCPRPNCPRKGERGFSRKDHLTEHLRTTHGRDIPPRRRERASS